MATTIAFNGQPGREEFLPELNHELLINDNISFAAEADGADALTPFRWDPSENACLIPEIVEALPGESSAFTEAEAEIAPADGISDFDLTITHVISLRQLNAISIQLHQCGTRDSLFETLENVLTFIFPTAEVAFSPDEAPAEATGAYSLVVPLLSGRQPHGHCHISRRECGFSSEELEFLHALGQQAGVALEVIQLAEERQRAFDRMIKALALTLDARDEMTAGHSARVANYSQATARYLGLAQAEQRLIYYAALLHDYGKIGVRDEVLCKSSELTPEEYEHIQQHSYYTFRMLSRINFGPEMSDIPLIASSHHERVDGAGYPRGLRGEDIHIGARIIAVTDFFDALTTVRHYRQPLPLDEVISLIEAGRDTQFDGQVIDAFRLYYEEEYRPRRLRSRQLRANHAAVRQP